MSLNEKQLLDKNLRQTMQTLLMEKQTDQALHCLVFLQVWNHEPIQDF